MGVGIIVGSYMMNRWTAACCLLGMGTVAGCSGDQDASSVTVAGSPMVTGARLYESNCIACHQQDARGIPGVYPSLVDSPVVLGDPKAMALWVIKGVRPAALPAGRYPTQMPQFGWFSPQDAAGLLTYVRSSFGNHAPAVDAAAVAQALGESL